MKRSEINATIKQFEELLDKYKFRIPPYLSFTPEEWAEKDHEWDEIRDNMLGWDITDYGEGDFEHKGLALITLRNGNELSLDFGIVEQLGAKVVAIASLVGGGAKDINVVNPSTGDEQTLPFIQVFDESELR